MARTRNLKADKQAADAPPPEETKVFLSYSRKDAATLQRIADALITHPEFQPDFDKAEHDPDKVGAGISADEPWWQRLEQMIAGAEAMVFLVSSHSAASKVCDEEIAYAQRLGKRIIPVLAGAVDFAKLPPKLNSLNIAIDFTEAGPGFDAALVHLIRVLSVNAAWLREGRRYTERAADWERKGRPKSGLLPSGAFEEAEAWASRRPKNEPEPGELFSAWVAASRASIQEQIARERRQIRRARLWQAAAAIILICGFSALAYAGWFLVSEQRAFSKSKSLMLARTAEQFLIEQDYQRALLMSILASRDTALSPATSEANAIFASSSQTTKQLLAFAHETGVSGAMFSPDQRRVLTWDSQSARLWDSASGLQIGSTMTLQGYPRNGVEFSADGSLIITWSGYTARTWDAATGLPIGPPLTHKREVGGAALTKKNDRILTWNLDTAFVWNADSGKSFEIFLKHDHWVDGVAFSNDETKILSWSDDGTAKLWNAENGELLIPALQHEAYVLGAKFLGDGKRILTWSGDKTARLWDAATGVQIGPPLVHEAGLRGATVSADQTRILTWSADSTARIWDASTGAQIGPSLQHESGVVGATFSKDETRILSWSLDGTVRIWDASTGTQVEPSLPHESAVASAAFSKDETRILSRIESSAMVWDVLSGELVGSPLYHDGLKGATFSEDGARILTWSRDGTARLWEAPYIVTGDFEQKDSTLSLQTKPTFVLARSDSAAWFKDLETGEQFGPTFRQDAFAGGALGALSTKATRVVTWSILETGVTLWDAASGAKIGSPLQHESPIGGATFSSDDSRVLIWSYDQAASVWGTNTGKLLGRFRKHEGKILGGMFSTNGEKVLTWSEDDTARLWDVASSDQIGEGFRHAHYVSGARFFNNETRVLTWSDDGTVKVWDASSGIQVGRTLAHSTETEGVEISEYATRILTWSENNVRLWDATTGLELGPPYVHRDDVVSARFSEDEAIVFVSSENGQQAAWDVSWAMKPQPVAEDIAAICRKRLQGSLVPARSGEATPFPRLIDDEMVAAAPILRGREGEDVCIPQQIPWWDKPLQMIIDRTGME
jgi:WD40 repeat protein